MCGIFGIGFLSKCKNHEFVIQLIKELLNSVEIRGTDASGVAFISDTKIYVVKDGVSGKTLSKSMKFREACEEMVNENLLQIIGHCRAQTKGSFLHDVNNHPIVANKIIGVHNGQVSNDDILFDKYVKQGNMIRAGEVDTEIIFRLMDYYTNNKNTDIVKSVYKALEELNGSFSCAFTHVDKPHILGLFRVYNPTTVRHYIKDDMVIYCSAGNLINVALNKFKTSKLSEYKELTYGYKSAMFINLQTGKFHTVSDLPA